MGARIIFPFSAQAPGWSAKPFLPIEISTPAHTVIPPQYAFGLVDTGAAVCSIPAEFAPLLNHNLRRVKATAIQGAGSVAQGFPHTVRIRALAMKLNGRVNYAETVFDTGAIPVHFVPGLPCVLIGVKDFLEHFVLTVDYPQQTFSLTR
jgi:hypothetical protein